MRLTREKVQYIDISKKGGFYHGKGCCHSKTKRKRMQNYKAAVADNKIGAATVCRMINTLEEIGVVTRQIRIADVLS